MYKILQKVLFLILTLGILVTCFYKKRIENTVIQQIKMPDIKTDYDLDVGRKLISNNSHYFIRQQQLPPFRTDTNPQRILLIGDSMSKWLRYRLQDYCEENGHKLFTVTWVSGNTEWFAKFDTLSYFIKKEKISYVFLVLGSNELFIKDFEKSRGANVDKIVKKLDGVKWIWVGPPNWKKDKGINDCLLGKLGDRKFFVSKELKFKRQSDGMHPTIASCSIWVDSVVIWISNQSSSRIKLNVPDSSYNLKPDAVLLKPLL